MKCLTSRLFAAASVALLATLPEPSVAQEGEPAVLARMRQINNSLRAMGKKIAVQQMDFITIGRGRPANRIHQSGARWVPNDPRRFADGNRLTYLVDRSAGATTSGLTPAQTEAAIDRAMATWNANQCLKKVDLVKRPDSGDDPDIFDFFYGFGGYGDPYRADIVNAGWLPAAFFDAVAGPGGGDGILAFSVTFIFLNDDGTPSDLDGDNYLDTALNEVYYNDTFGDPSGNWASSPWAINQPLPAFDVQTIAFHENGHSLGLGHFGPPPSALMNPVYGGIRQKAYPIDSAGMCAVYASWPRK